MSKALRVLLLTMVSGLAFAGEPIRIKLATVPDRYTPTNASVSEPVSVQGFHFEVNPETVRARLVVEYTYPDEIVYEKNDDRGGPQPTIVQLPGLKYLPGKHAIVYEKNGKQAVCAHVHQRAGLLHHGLHIQNTGACSVTSEDAKHAEDDGWQIRRFKGIDTYFEVRTAEIPDTDVR
jgi:hypothetical protein